MDSSQAIEDLSSWELFGTCMLHIYALLCVLLRWRETPRMHVFQRVFLSCILTRPLFVCARFLRDHLLCPLLCAVQVTTDP